MTVARMLWGFIERRDHRVMRQMNRWRAPGWFRMWMILATRLGDGWLWYGLAFLLLAWGGPQRIAAVGAAGSAALVGVLVFKALKHLSHRMRPCQFEPHCWSNVLPPDKFSFPSGHTMTAFSVALVAVSAGAGQRAALATGVVHHRRNRGVSGHRRADYAAFPADHGFSRLQSRLQHNGYRGGDCGGAGSLLCGEFAAQGLL